MNCIHSFSNFRLWAFFRILETISKLSIINDDHYGICLLSLWYMFTVDWTVNIYHNGHHGCYLAVKIVITIIPNGIIILNYNNIDRTFSR